MYSTLANTQKTFNKFSENLDGDDFYQFVIQVSKQMPFLLEFAHKMEILQ
jgi:sulfur transfer protein SufE